jgi:hypothetical protein
VNIDVAEKKGAKNRGEKISAGRSRSSKYLIGLPLLYPGSGKLLKMKTYAITGKRSGDRRFNAAESETRKMAW